MRATQCPGVDRLTAVAEPCHNAVDREVDALGPLGAALLGRCRTAADFEGGNCVYWLNAAVLRGGMVMRARSAS